MRPERQTEAAARPAMARVFFALWPPPAVAEQLAGIARDAAARFGGQPTRRDTIHLTLAFLGDVPEAELGRLVAVGESVQAPAFELAIDQLGFWSHNRLLWAGSQSPDPDLITLVEGLRAALAAAGFTPADAKRVFVPHVTLLRKVAGHPGPAQLPAVAQIVWPGRSFVLVRSHRSANGSDYQRLAELPLAS